MTTNDTDWSTHPFYDSDPLPDIDRALLNSLDIKRYVDQGCLLDKDNFDPERMKPASYEMRFLGRLYHWQELDGRLQSRWRKVSEHNRVTLRKNSISYLWMEERLLLPEYIGARFNLRISDVHKGILLGTGPLIDPGFGGRLLIPLHNLTDNDYVLVGGKGIIWVEFTKVSKNCYWLQNRDDRKRPEGLVEFPSRKVIDKPHRYLEKAGVLAQGGVQSAFKGELDRTTYVADRAKSDSEDAQQRVAVLEARARKWGFGGLFVGVVAVVGIVISAYSLTFPVMGKVHDQSKRIDQLEKSLDDLRKAMPNKPVVTQAEETHVTSGTAAQSGQAVKAPELPIEMQ